jgi:hypothetical protein
MSEKIYARLLRLFPSHFRETYGDAALQLFRDRSRIETGFFPRLRLWLDLLTDLAVSLPRVRRPAGLSVALGGAPSFHVLEDESLHFVPRLLGVVLSLVAFATGSFLIGHGGSHWALNPTGGAGEAAVASGLPAPQDTMASGGVAAQAEPAKLDAAQRKSAIDGAIANLKQYYVYPDVAQKMADALLAHQTSGDYDAVTDGETFADLLTWHMRDVSHDYHLWLGYSRVSPFPLEPPPEVIARGRKFLELSNCWFAKIEILPHNIGYLQLNAFPDPSECESAATAAMAKLNSADAIIFDLRYNGGGSRKMVALIATYLFDQPTHLNDFYNRAENLTEQSWTLAPVPGNRLADKPAYVLTSRGTFSGAEEFSYDLKMLKRATIVGEATGGGAHMSSPHRIDDHFAIFVPAARAINPISKTDWEGTGVEPDVKVKAANALAMAEKLAESKLRKK